MSSCPVLFSHLSNHKSASKFVHSGTRLLNLSRKSSRTRTSWSLMMMPRRRLSSHFVGATLTGRWQPHSCPACILWHQRQQGFRPHGAHFSRTVSGIPSAARRPRSLVNTIDLWSRPGRREGRPCTRVPGKGDVHGV